MHRTCAAKFILGWSLLFQTLFLPPKASPVAGAGVRSSPLEETRLQSRARLLACIRSANVVTMNCSRL